MPDRLVFGRGERFGRVRAQGRRSAATPGTQATASSVSASVPFSPVFSDY